MFSNEGGLAKLAAEWPAGKLVEIWNSIPGVVPLKKFKDRQTAVSRIWKAIQGLNASAVATATASEEPEEGKEAEANRVPPVEVATDAPPEEAVPQNAEPASDMTVAPQTPDVAPETAPAKNKATRVKKAPKPATQPTPPARAAKPRRFSS